MGAPAIPHLSEGISPSSASLTLREYQRISRLPPRRVVVHKSSRFWGSEHGKYDELAGFYAGVEAINADASIDLVTLARSDVRLARIGQIQ